VSEEWEGRKAGKGSWSTVIRSHVLL
jgi:hypothetical protein